MRNQTKFISALAIVAISVPFGASALPTDGAGEQRAFLDIQFRSAGSFKMGSPPTELERRPGEDQVDVTISHGFWMGETEVTQGEWKRVMGALPGEVNERAGIGDD